MNPKLTDDAVADLPLHAGRADLLEEIMRTPVVDRRPVPAAEPRRRATRWLVPAAAAALVGVLAGATAWWGGNDAAGSGGSGHVAASDPNSAADSYRAVLEAPRWTAEYVNEEKELGGEVRYVDGRASLEINWRPADQYDNYLDDRRHITDPPTDGQRIEVLGLPAQMWAYGAKDHTAIRQVEGGQSFFLEVRGSGMDEAAYLSLLGRLRLVDADAFAADLPGKFVSAEERPRVIAEILDGMDAVADPLLPPGLHRSDITSDQADRYQLGVDVVGPVVCGWLAEFADARRSGDQAGADRAAAVLATSKRWPILREMARTGGYPGVVWDDADQVAAGRVPEGYAEGLGCSD